MMSAALPTPAAKSARPATGGMAGYWLCELLWGDAGWQRDTQSDGRVWAWCGLQGRLRAEPADGLPPTRGTR
jgi:hypothetical protein